MNTSRWAEVARVAAAWPWRAACVVPGVMAGAKARCPDPVEVCLPCDGAGVGAGFRGVTAASPEYCKELKVFLCCLAAAEGQPFPLLPRRHCGVPWPDVRRCLPFAKDVLKRKGTLTEGQHALPSRCESVAPRGMAVRGTPTG